MDNHAHDYRGDGWAVMADGTRFWGVLGAAGLFLVSPDDDVLVQLRAAWTNRGGTWAVPGGARNPGESAAEAALRETWEETCVESGHVKILGECVTAEFPLAHVLRREPLTEKALLERVELGDEVFHPDHGGQGIIGLGNHGWWEIKDENFSEKWTYTTVIAECDEQLAFTATSESSDLAWYHIDKLEELDLLPAFKDALPTLRRELKRLRAK